MSDKSKVVVNHLLIGYEESGQRLDNYLRKHLKGIPKSHIYKIIRSGEIRVNGRRKPACASLGAAAAGCHPRPGRRRRLTCGDPIARAVRVVRRTP